MVDKRIPLIAKVILIHFIFLIMHYLYDWFPNRTTMIFSGINESIYQHMKIGFFTYLLFSLVEFLWIRKTIPTLRTHIYARLFSATYYPLIMMVIYLTGPLLFGQIKNIAFEVIFANIALLATSFSTLVVDEQIEKTKPGSLFRFAVILIFIFSAMQYVKFTYELPWFDIFAIPPGY